MNIIRRGYAYAGAATAAALASLSGPVLAADPFNQSNTLPLQGQSFTTAPNTTSAIVKIANTVINIVLLISGILAVFYLIWSGVRYITSAGNPEKIKEARGGIINAIIGIVIILAAFFLVRFAVSLGNTASNAA